MLAPLTISTLGRPLAVTGSWCAKGYSVATVGLASRPFDALQVRDRLDTPKHESPISIFTSANQEMGT